MVKNIYIKVLVVLFLNHMKTGNLIFWDNVSSDESEKIIENFNDNRIKIYKSNSLKNFMKQQT